MTLPTFLGIGAPRAGTTWLHTLLAGHPEVYMPTRRKEIRFFERYYDRGLDWYETFFCPAAEAAKYRAIGEFSTQYYDCEPCPERIARALPGVKLIVMLRHPVSRAYSHYGFCVQRKNYRGSFEEFFQTRTSASEKGFYSRHLDRYLQFFPRTQILPLVFERLFPDTLAAHKTIADFLDIDPGRFPTSAARKVNASTLPKHASLYSMAVTAGRRLRRYRLEPVVDFVKRLGVDRLLGKGPPLPPLDEGLKRRFAPAYRDEIVRLEQCLQLDLSCWRDSA